MRRTGDFDQFSDFSDVTDVIDAVGDPLYGEERWQL